MHLSVNLHKVLIDGAYLFPSSIVQQDLLAFRVHKKKDPTVPRSKNRFSMAFTRPLIIITLLLLFSSYTLSAQNSDPPTFSIIPSDRWCIEHGYYQKKEKGTGRSHKDPEPSKALKKNDNLKKAAKVLKKGLEKEGFKELSLKKAKDGERPDFKIHLSWELQGKSLNLSLNAKYGKSMAASALEAKKIEEGMKERTALKKVVSENVKELADGMKKYMENIKENGIQTRVMVSFAPSSDLMPSDTCKIGEEKRMDQVFKEAVKKHSLSEEVRMNSAGMGKMRCGMVRRPFEWDKKTFGKKIFLSAKEKCSLLKNKKSEFDASVDGKITISVK